MFRSRSPAPAHQPPEELVGRESVPEMARGTTPPGNVSQEEEEEDKIIETSVGHGHVRRGRTRFLRETLDRNGYRVLRCADRVAGSPTVHAQKITTGTLHVVECLCNRQRRAERFMSSLASHPNLLRFDETFGDEEELFCVSQPLAVLDSAWFVRCQVEDKDREVLLRAWMAQIVSAHSHYSDRGFRRDSFSWDAVYLAEDLTVRLGGYRYVAPVDCNSHLPKRVYRSPECLRKECETVTAADEKDARSCAMKAWSWNLGATLLEVMLDRSVAGPDFVVPKSRISKQKVLRHVRKNVPRLPQLLRTLGVTESACAFFRSTLDPSPSTRWGLKEVQACEWIRAANDRECAELVARSKPWITGPYVGILVESSVDTVAVSQLTISSPLEPLELQVSENNLEIVERMIKAAEMIKDAISALEFSHTCLDRLDEKVDMVTSTNRQ